MDQERNGVESAFHEAFPTSAKKQSCSVSIPDAINNLSNAIQTFANDSGEIVKRREAILKATKSINDHVNLIINSTLTHEQICCELNITRPTLIKRRNKGLIPFIKLGRDYFYFKPDLVGGYNV